MRSRSGAGLGWARAYGNPQTGEIRAVAAANNHANSVASWDVTSPAGTFHIIPQYWGEGLAASYLRSVWRIESPSGTLKPGDSASLAASLTLGGALENGPRATYQAAVLLNTSSAADWLAGNEHIDMHAVQDMIGMGRSFGHLFREGDSSGTVGLSDTYTGNFRIGDVVVMETLLQVFAGAPNDGTPKEVWSRFDQTLQSQLEVLTAGAVLVAVPEPHVWVTLLAGLGMIAARVARRTGRGAG